MMKKILSILMLLIIPIVMVSFNNNFLRSQEENANISIDSEVGLLMEYSTGKIIYQKNADKKMYPASMTKMIGLYLVLERIYDGSINLNDIVTISEYASSMGGSQVFLQPGEQISVEDLFKAVSIVSANDAIVAFGELISGSEENFVVEMNNKAKQLGMNNSNFVNPTGFHDPNHYTTASDMALLGIVLINQFGDLLLKYTSIYDSYIRENTPNPFWLVNTNKLVRFYPGMDGLKTGFTSESGYNLTATAKRDGLRFISVVMNGATSKSRNADISKMMDYGFNTYKSHILYKADEVVTTFSFLNGKSIETPLVSLDNVRVTLKRNENIKNIKVKVTITKYDSPIKKGEIVGYIEVVSPDNSIATYDLVSSLDVDKLSFFDLLNNFLKQILF